MKRKRADNKSVVCYVFYRILNLGFVQRIFFLCFLVFSFVPSIKAEEAFRVAKIDYDILRTVSRNGSEQEKEGRTKEKAIRYYVNVKEGDAFPTEEAMREALEKEKQNLINYRVFKEVSLKITELPRESDPSEERRFHAVYRVVDSWTLLPIPYPKYDSNTGLRLGLKTYWYNTLGTMTDSYLGLGLDIKRNPATGRLETGEWTINPKWSNLKIGRMYWTANLLQQYVQEKFPVESSSLRYDYSYYRTVFGISSFIDFPKDWFYEFSPGVELRYGYQDTKKWGNYRESPLNITWVHSGGWGRIHWENNFRRGHQYSLQHSLKASYEPNEKKALIINALDVSALGYLPLGKIFNWYGKAGAFIVWNDRRSGVGSYARGVRDDSLSGYTGAYLNNSIGTRIWRLPEVWDIQVHPFFDLVLAVPNRTEAFVPARDFHYGAGLDFVLFLDALPSLVARMTVGVDLSRYSWSDGRKYEIIITSSLSY